MDSMTHMATLNSVIDGILSQTFDDVVAIVPMNPYVFVNQVGQFVFSLGSGFHFIDVDLLNLLTTYSLVGELSPRLEADLAFIQFILWGYRIQAAYLMSGLYLPYHAGYFNGMGVEELKDNLAALESQLVALGLLNYDVCPHISLDDAMAHGTTVGGSTPTTGTIIPATGTTESMTSVSTGSPGSTPFNISSFHDLIQLQLVFSDINSVIVNIQSVDDIQSAVDSLQHAPDSYKAYMTVLCDAFMNYYTAIPTLIETLKMEIFIIENDCDTDQQKPADYLVGGEGFCCCVPGFYTTSSTTTSSSTEPATTVSGTTESHGATMTEVHDSMTTELQESTTAGSITTGSTTNTIISSMSITTSAPTHSLFSSSSYSTPYGAYCPCAPRVGTTVGIPGRKERLFIRSLTPKDQ